MVITIGLKTEVAAAWTVPAEGSVTRMLQERFNTSKGTVCHVTRNHTGALRRCINNHCVVKRTTAQEVHDSSLARTDMLLVGQNANPHDIKTATSLGLRHMYVTCKDRKQETLAENRCRLAWVRRRRKTLDETSTCGPGWVINSSPNVMLELFARVVVATQPLQCRETAVFSVVSEPTALRGPPSLNSKPVRDTCGAPRS